MRQPARAAWQGRAIFFQNRYAIIAFGSIVRDICMIKDRAAWEKWEADYSEEQP